MQYIEFQNMINFSVVAFLAGFVLYYVFSYPTVKEGINKMGEDIISFIFTFIGFTSVGVLLALTGAIFLFPAYILYKVVGG